MTIDLTQMLINLGKSLVSVQQLIIATAYLVGTVLMVGGIYKFKGSTGASSHEHLTGPLSMIAAGASLLFFPTMLDVWTATFFGVASPLEYVAYIPDSLITAIEILIQTAGLIWFMKGCVMIARSTEAGVDEAFGITKAVAAIFSGILAINIQSTISWLQYALNYLMSVIF